jgi:predicted amidohydrolase YtcJ
MALANTAALKAANISRETPDPPGGLIVKDPKTGEPTGVLKDAAMNLVYKVIPEHSFAAKLAAAEAASHHAASLGVTSVTDMSAGEDLAVYQALLEQGKLKTRIYAAHPLPQWQRPANAGIRRGFGSAMLRTGILKGFADGSLGSTTALFFSAYSDAPGTSGLPSDEMIPPSAMRDRILAADKAGLQIAIHAIGDRANHEILSLFEQANQAGGSLGRRFRVEHAQHLRPADMPRFKAGGIIASMQPYHAADDGRWCDKRIGQARSKGTYAFRSLLDAGAILAFGSDWSVAPLNPLTGIHAAVTRRTLDGKNPGGWVPEQKISVEEAVRAYGWGSAYAELMDHQKGTLEPGMLGDVVLLSQDIFEIAPEKIEQVKVLLTVVGGRVVFESPIR